MVLIRSFSVDIVTPLPLCVCVCVCAAVCVLLVRMALQTVRRMSSRPPCSPITAHYKSKCRRYDDKTISLSP